MSFCVVGVKKKRDYAHIVVTASNGEEIIIKVTLTDNKRNSSSAWIGIEADKEKVKIKKVDAQYLKSTDENGDISGNK